MFITRPSYAENGKRFLLSDLRDSNIMFLRKVRSLPLFRRLNADDEPVSMQRLFLHKGVYDVNKIEML